MTEDDDRWKATLEAVEQDVKRSAADTDIAKRIEASEAERLEQANELRAPFFWCSLSFAAVTIVASAAIVIRIVAGKDVNPTIAVAFISGLSVEVLGILAIVANYLFPNGAGKKDP